MKKIKITEKQYEVILKENATKKSGVKNLKVTKKQYDKLLASGIINENNNKLKLIIEDDKSSDDKNNDKFSIETFLAFLYNKPGVIPSLLKNYEEFRDMLLKKKIITKNGDGYSVSKSLGDPKSAKKSIEEEISNYSNDIGDDSMDLETEGKYKTIYVGDEVSILKGSDNKLYCFYYTKIGDNGLLEVIGDFGDDINPSEITDYVNSNIDSLSTGKGLEGVLKDKDLIEIDPALAKDLIDVYTADTGLKNALTKQNGTGEEMSLGEDGAMGGGAMGGNTTGGVMGSGSPVGPFSGPIKKDSITQDIPIVGEGATVGGVGGQYDTPGFVGVTKDHNLGKAPKTNAQKKTQYSGGGFVELDDCTKLNNNNKAQNGGCSQGAVDNVVKVKKTKGSIISPSLNENKIYEVIAKKTGKSIEEVKKIIQYNNKVTTLSKKLDIYI